MSRLGSATLPDSSSPKTSEQPQRRKSESNFYFQADMLYVHAHECPPPPPTPHQYVPAHTHICTSSWSRRKAGNMFASMSRSLSLLSSTYHPHIYISADDHIKNAILSNIHWLEQNNVKKTKTNFTRHLSSLVPMSFKKNNNLFHQKCNPTPGSVKSEL